MDFGNLLDGREDEVDTILFMVPRINLSRIDLFNSPLLAASCIAGSEYKTYCGALVGCGL